MAMRTPSITAGDRDLGRGLRISLLAHAALFLLIFAKAIVFPSKPIPYIPALRVDIVGLPELLKQDVNILPPTPSAGKPVPEAKPEQPEPAKAKPVQAKVTENAAPDEMVFKAKKLQEAKNKRDEKLRKQREEKEEQAREDAQEHQRKNKMKNALARIRSLDKISGGENHARKSDAGAGILIKGNRISKGSSLRGDARESDEASYLDLLRDKLQANWELPVWIARQNLSAKVQLFIDGRGRVRNFRFVQPSGNAQFDDAVKRTISESQPFASPPDGIASNILVDGILVGFPL